MGHEITHGFDELRRHTDKDGRRITIWSNETIDVFNRRSKCIIEQYNNYTVEQVNLKINGKRTRDENIADNDGLKKAFAVMSSLSSIGKCAILCFSGLSKVETCAKGDGEETTRFDEVFGRTDVFHQFWSSVVFENER